MKKKKITKETLQKMINSLPKEVKQKMIEAKKVGKKITLKIKANKKGDDLTSPYQNK